MRPPRPAGFVFLTACAVLCAAVMALGLADADFASEPVSRFALAATGALALVTAEALALVRPWAYGASIALAGSFVAMVFVVAGSIEVSLAIACVVALPILSALSIVYNGLRPVPPVTHGPQRIRVP